MDQGFAKDKRRIACYKPGLEAQYESPGCTSRACTWLDAHATSVATADHGHN